MRTFYPIRKATRYDLSRIAEIYVFNNRINYFPIFNDESFSFGKLQVISLADAVLLEVRKCSEICMSARMA